MTNRIYYTGDMANQPGWFTGTHQSGNVLLVEEGGEHRRFTVLPHHIGDVYQGHCNPRFVTEEAYKAFYFPRAWLTETERAALGLR